jgi:hypothetical protein
MSLDPPHLSSFHRAAVFALGAALTLTLSGFPPVNAQDPKKSSVAGLEGSWSGGGTVSFASGTEQVRCRARFRRAGEHSYTVNAICATASGRAAQTAKVRQLSNNNRYSGSFYNSEYAISGVIDIVVHGSSQTVRLTSDAGSGILNLSR